MEESAQCGGIVGSGSGVLIDGNGNSVGATDVGIAVTEAEQAVSTRKPNSSRRILSHAIRQP